MFFYFQEYNFLSTDDITCPFIVKVCFYGRFNHLISLNKLINTNVYFLTSYLNIDLLGSSIPLDFGYELTKLLVINNIKFTCLNMTIVIIYKGNVVFAAAAFN